MIVQLSKGDPTVSWREKGKAGKEHAIQQECSLRLPFMKASIAHG